jgi:DNA polymerase III subunit alpha
LFRPACMASGMTDLYIERRKDPSKRKGIVHPHPAFDEVLKDTFGIVLFQEQVLNIMRKLGLDYEGINTFFKIVKDSGKGATARNIERLAEVEERWAEICEKNGIEDPDAAWTYIEGYTQYGFNKAHSTGYGLRSYRVAFLKTHHPLEYMTALLESWAGRQKEPVYVKEARRLGIRLLSPDVNISGPVWTLDRKKSAIRRGLSSIKGVGQSSAEQIAVNAPYEDIEELIAKNNARAVTGGKQFLKDGSYSGALDALRKAGALSSLGIGRDD